VRIEVAEGGGKQQRRAILRNHAGHGLLHGGGLGHVFFLHHLDAGHLLELGRSQGLGLVVAVVVARADVDHAHGQRLGLCAGQRAPTSERAGGAERGQGLEGIAAIEGAGHGVLSRS
jgi:hypothetical protein